MSKTIETSENNLRPFFEKMYQQGHSFILLTPGQTANLQAHIESTPRPGLDRPVTIVKAVLDLLKTHDLAQPEILRQLVEFERKAYAAHIKDHGFRFDRLTDEEINAMHILLNTPPGRYASITATIQVYEMVESLRSRNYDVKSLEVLEKVDGSWDQKLLSTIKKHPQKNHILRTIFESLTAETDASKLKNPLMMAIANQVNRLKQVGVTGPQLKMYLEFRNVILPSTSDVSRDEIRASA